MGLFLTLPGISTDETS